MNRMAGISSRVRLSGIFFVVIATLHSRELIAGAQTDVPSVSGVTSQMILGAAPRITETNCSSLAIDGMLTVQDAANGANIVFFLRTNGPDKFSFVLADEDDSVPALVITTNRAIYYDRNHDRVWVQHSGRFRFVFGSEEGRLLWNCFWGGGALGTNESHRIDIDFPSVMAAFVVDCKTTKMNKDTHWLFTGNTKRGSSAEVLFVTDAVPCYRQATIRTKEIRIEFRSMALNCRIDDAAFCGPVETLRNKGIEIGDMPDGKSGAAENALGVIGIAKMGRRGPRELVVPTRTARLLKESFERMRKPVARDEQGIENKSVSSHRQLQKRLE